MFTPLFLHNHQQQEQRLHLGMDKLACIVQSFEEQLQLSLWRLRVHTAAQHPLQPASPLPTKTGKTSTASTSYKQHVASTTAMGVAAILTPQ
jgi:hypothetical protein